MPLFWRGLAAFDWKEGANLQIDWRYGGGDRAPGERARRARTGI
jgi:hypothetical protein